MVTKLRTTETELELVRNKIDILESSIRSKSHRVEELEKEVENVHGVNEEKLLYMQMQMNVSKSKEESRDKELSSL
jgi:hypothetical protein